MLRIASTMRKKVAVRLRLATRHSATATTEAPTITDVQMTLRRHTLSDADVAAMMANGSRATCYSAQYAALRKEELRAEPDDQLPNISTEERHAIRHMKAAVRETRHNLIVQNSFSLLPVDLREQSASSLDELKASLCAARANLQARNSSSRASLTGA